MIDLRDRFQSLDRLAAPDLWSEARARAAARPAASGWRSSIGQPLFAFLLVAALAALLSIGLAVAGGLLRDVRPAIPSPSPTATAELGFAIPGQPIVPGRYRIYGVPGASLLLSLEIPVGWKATTVTRAGGISRDATTGSPSAELKYGPVTNLVARSCQSSGSPALMASPPIGPTVEDLVAGLRSIPGFAFSAPARATIDGRPATRLELDHPAACAGEAKIWDATVLAESWGTVSQPGWHTTIWILELDGERIAVVAQRNAAAASLEAEIQSMVDSIAIQR